MRAAIPAGASANHRILFSTLILLAFASAFFPRILSALGIPAIVNFLHFVILPIVAAYVICKTWGRNRQQIGASAALLIGLLTLFGVMLASALLNNAGVINVILDFLLLAEPFIFLLAIANIPMTPTTFEQIRRWIISFGLIHIGLAFVQRYVLRYDLSRSYAGADMIQGVFYFSGSGHVVGASVALTIALYYLITGRVKPLWVRLAVVGAAFWHMLIADAKQVLLTFFVAWALLMLGQLKNLGRLIQSLLAAVVIGVILWWCIQNVPAFAAFNVWNRPELYGPQGDATQLKLASIVIIPTYFESPLNWLLGLGPGHTVGRLGGWMIREYAGLLLPLGATAHPASQAVWSAVSANWLGSQSSMFSPLFGWAGIWGDLGFLGLATYLYLSIVVWFGFCRDSLSKYLMLTVCIFGFIFSQMEEPGYMLTIAVIIGLQWQEHRIRSALAAAPPTPILAFPLSDPVSELIAEPEDASQL